LGQFGDDGEQPGAEPVGVGRLLGDVFGAVEFGEDDRQQLRAGDGVVEVAQLDHPRLQVSH
jgi:hypothetical protein